MYTMLPGLLHATVIHKRPFRSLYAQCINALDSIRLESATHCPLLSVHKLLLTGSSVLVSGAGCGVSGRKLLFSLLVAVRDETVQERAWSAGRVVFGLCGFNFAVEVAGGLIISIVVVLVVVGLDCIMSVFMSLVRLPARSGLPSLSFMLRVLPSFWRILSIVMCEVFEIVIGLTTVFRRKFSLQRSLLVLVMPTALRGNTAVDR